MKLTPKPERSRSRIRPIAVLLATVLALVLFPSCRRQDGPVPYTTRVIEGSVRLPDGAAVDLTRYRVVTTADQAAIHLGQFKANVVDGPTHQTLFVADLEDSVLMLKILAAPSGAAMPAVIDATSTAIGLVLLRPWLSRMTEAVRVEAEAAVAASPAFPALAKIVAAKIATGADLFGADYAADLGPAVDAVIADITPPTPKSKKVSFGPLTITSDGSNVVFTNTVGAAYSHVVGVYAPPTIHAPGAMPVLSGQTPVPTSFVGLFQTVAGTAASPPLSIPMMGDQMTLRVRTGLVLDGTQEAEKAQRINLGTAIIEALNMIPLGNFVSGSQQCEDAVVTFILTRHLGLLDPTDTVSGLKKIANWFEAMAVGIPDVSLACGPILGRSQSLRLFAKGLSAYAVYGGIANSENLLIMFAELAVSPTAGDFCARSVNGTIDIQRTACGGPPRAAWQVSFTNLGNGGTLPSHTESFGIVDASGPVQFRGAAGGATVSCSAVQEYPDDPVVSNRFDLEFVAEDAHASLSISGGPMVIDLPGGDYGNIGADLVYWSPKLGVPKDQAIETDPATCSFDSSVAAGGTGPGWIGLGFTCTDDVFGGWGGYGFDSDICPNADECYSLTGVLFFDGCSSQ
jgi:hypothetical protein